MADHQELDQVQPVRDAARRAAWQTWRLRVWLRFGLFLLLALPPIILIAPIGVRNQSVFFAIAIGVGACNGVLAGALASRIHRRLRAKEPQGRFAALGTVEREQLLQEMCRDEHVDVSALAAAVTQSLPLAGREPLPASAPDGSGHEGAPAA